jgi:hypothetical protein
MPARSATIWSDSGRHPRPIRSVMLAQCCSPNSCNFLLWSNEKTSATFKYRPLASRKMIFRFVDYPILGLNLGFEISDICRRAIRRRSADAPCAVFALLCPNRQVRIYVAHESEYALIRLDRKRRAAGCVPGTSRKWGANEGYVPGIADAHLQQELDAPL